MKEERTYESVKRYFTEAEIAEMHEALVVRVGEVKELRGEKKQVDSTLGASIKTAEKGVFDLQEKLATGYEVMDVEVIAIMDEPSPGQKKIIRTDNNEVLRTEPMTSREKQQSFGFEEPGKGD
jgi:hypothetical protein